MSQCPRLRWIEKDLENGAKEYKAGLTRVRGGITSRWEAKIYLTSSSGKHVLHTPNRQPGKYEKLDTAKNIAKLRANVWWTE